MSEVERQWAIVSGLQATIGNLSTEIESVRTDRDALRADLLTTRAELDATRAELDATRATTTWRLHDRLCRRRAVRTAVAVLGSRRRVRIGR